MYPLYSWAERGMMKWYLTLVFILLYSQVSFCHFEELKENTFLHLKKIPSTFTSNEIGMLDAVVCPGAIKQCPSLHSCCSVPGSDEVHCCPAGYSCKNGVCQETRKDDVAALFPSTGAKIVKCNNQYACPDRYTCCQDGSKYHCCPMSEAVCCPDQLHCCPQGYSCSKDGKTCSSGSDTVASLSSTSPKSLKKPLERLLEQIKGQYSSKKTLLLKQSTVKMGKIAASKSRDHDKIPVMKKKLLIKDSNLNDVLCPDGESECPDGNTCCKLHTRDWGCCPFPKAVCCDDGIHCCPGNTKCNIEKKTCDRKTDIETLLTKIQVWKGETGKSNIICPDGQSECPEGNTCCKLQSGQYGCCPLPKAVCCSDGEHCCPNGYTCDVSAGTCTQGSSSLPMVKKMSSSKRESIASNIVCPDGQSECPEGSTCCKLSSAVQVITHIRAGSGIVCPDKQYQCPNGSTCCKVPSGTYGCCPLKNAVCCSDNIHCCPEGYTCDVKGGKCDKSAERIKMMHNVPSSRSIMEARQNYIKCPDGCSCLDYETCCELADGSYGCCPLPHAVCCEDHKHCCPSGYRCDLAAGMCVTGNVRLPMLKKIRSPRKQKTPRVNLDEKVRFVPSHVQDEYPVAKDLLQ
ncbi:hypothetical protein pdam_00019018 [Pocillopora damicornis]|uniref:Granulins domain-containing protein n=1 Tax=Pocillopora damicornis TaxID=46731 RepID=A0A3M6V2C8_POCDA|nr:hypothetical protein pdam_00019018 [Pocillopora damicornis]